MNIQIDKYILQKNLENISKVVSTSLHLPALTGIVIESSESNIILIASNGTLSTKIAIPLGDGVTVNEPGKILVPGKLFINLIKRQSKQILVVSTDNETTISSEGQKTKLNLLNINDYPAIVFDNFGSKMTLDAEIFKNAISKVAFAASENDRRVILMGVNLKAKDGKLKVSGTNSFRLAQTTINTDSELDFNVTVLAKSIRDFIPTGFVGEFTLNVTDTKIVTKIGNIQILLSVVDGVYPEIEKLIPEPGQQNIIIDAKTLVTYLDDVAVMSTEANKVVQLSISSNKTILRAKRQEIGHSEVEIKHSLWSGESFEIAFNLQFMKEAVSRYSGDLKIGFYGPGRPIVIRPISDNNSIQLVLPHRNY